MPKFLKEVFICYTSRYTSRMSVEVSRDELKRALEELKKAEKTIAEHKRNAQSGGAEWRGTWDNGHWCGHNSTDLNRIYTSLYSRVQKAQEKVEQLRYKVDPYRRDIDAKIKKLMEQRKAGSMDVAKFNPTLDRLVLVIQRKMNYSDEAGKESLCDCKHFYGGRKVRCNCIVDDIGFLSLSEDNEELLKNKRVCFIGDHHTRGGNNWGKPVRGPIKTGKGHLIIEREWVREGKNLFQRCEHYHQRPSGWIYEPRDIVPCDCIKRDGFHNVNPENIYIKNDYYILRSNELPIRVSRSYEITGVTPQGSDTIRCNCIHTTNVKGCEKGDFSEKCDCQATGELSEKLKKFDARGLVEKKFYSTNLNAKITISRVTSGLIPHPQGHSCRHERDDGGSMECDCIPLFNKYTVDKFEDVVYELSEDMKKRQAAGRVILANDGNLQIGGFFKCVFFPGSEASSHSQNATPYDDDKYVVF